LDDFVSEVVAHRVATETVDLKTLLQRQTAGLKSNIHQPGAGEVGVGENWKGQSPRILPTHLILRKYEILHRQSLGDLANEAKNSSEHGYLNARILRTEYADTKEEKKYRLSL